MVYLPNGKSWCSADNLDAILTEQGGNILLNLHARHLGQGSDWSRRANSPRRSLEKSAALRHNSLL